MRHDVTTSWKRISDHQPGRAGSDAKFAPAVQLTAKGVQLEAWEGEGGKTAVAQAAVRFLIVDNDMRSADALELMLHASAYSETRVAYSGHAALAIAAEFLPDVILLDLTDYELGHALRKQAQRRGDKVDRVDVLSRARGSRAGSGGGLRALSDKADRAAGSDESDAGGVKRRL